MQPWIQICCGLEGVPLPSKWSRLLQGSGDFRGSGTCGLAMSSSPFYLTRPPKNKRVKPTASPPSCSGLPALCSPSLGVPAPGLLAYEKLKTNLSTDLPFNLLTLLSVPLHLSHIHFVPIFRPCLFLQPGPLVGTMLSPPGLQICLPSRDI